MQFKRHIMAGVLAAFAAWASADQLITSSVTPSSVIENGAVTVYVFSNATANATFTPVVPVVLDRALVVGGGGAGGWTIGGGGGAGGLVDFHPETPLMLVPGNTYSFSVGAG